MTIKTLTPKLLWSHFYQLTQIPRPSKHEQAVVEYCLKFAKERGLAAETDKVNNVIIRKPATAGMENCKTIVLQSHLDMVPQKNADTQHDFTKDPINTIIDGEWVTAMGTTLGADNGIGVAAILAVLESDDIPHGPLEALLTIDEEMGMTGAGHLEPGILKGDILFNLDTEEEGEIYIGCAGGVDVNAQWDISWAETPENHIGIDLSITGLLGGHSGVDIHLGRGNANKIANRILTEAMRRCTVAIAEFNGGSLRNAIPREAFLKLSIADADFDKFADAVNQLSQTIQEELQHAEPNLAISIAKTASPEKVFTSKFTEKVCQAFYACPHGVQRMSDTLKGVVETSNNLARIYIENDQLHAQNLVRSSVDTAREDTVNAIRSVFQLAGAEVTAENDYPGWTPNPHSETLKQLKSTYENLFGKIPKTQVIHAGLECGILGAKYPNWDMVSFGPTIRCAHSPDEKVHIKSVEKFWMFFIAALAAV